MTGPPDGIGSGRALSMSVEPRYNLATKVMSNGVEVIVAGDRTTRPGEPEFLRLLSSTVTRPITLAPHTLSHHMSMLLPADFHSENEVMSSLQPANPFITKTFQTTFIYPTAVKHGTKTQTITESTVATNVLQVNSEQPLPEASQMVTLSRSPVLESQVQKTVYTYLNTVLDGDQPLVATSKTTISNTVLALSTDLQPSEEIPETNTYYATREFTRTLTDGSDSQVVSTTDIVTQVIVTDPPQIETLTDDPGTIDVTKTYFVTYTYFSTYIDGDDEKVTSHVSVSSDITVEKFFVKAKKTVTITPTPAPLNIMFTKTFSKTMKTDDSEDIVMETIHHEGLNSELLHDISSKLSTAGENPIVTSAVLSDGEKIEVTAFQGDLIDEWFEQHKVKPTTESQVTKTKSKTKTTLKPKIKTSKTVSKQATTTKEIVPSNTYSTSVVLTSSVTPQGATLTPGDQVIVLHGDSGSKTVIPLTDPSMKKPKNDTDVQISDMLSLGALGINSMNVLGPVFNAMADLLKNHNKESLKRRNDTVPAKKTPNINPLLSAASSLKVPSEAKNPKTTTARIPVYIPVGSLAEDSETGESESRISVLPTPEKWVQERWPEKPVKQLDKNRRTHDTKPIPLLEGGIPISPGQVITTNSDVIIGRPSDSGPRPPIFAVKDNIPVDMRPPPVEEQRFHVDSIGQFSTNTGVNPGGRPIDQVDMKPPPLHPPQKPVRPAKTPLFHQNHHHAHDSGDMDLNPPPPPPQVVVRPANIVPIPVHLSPDQVVENYVNPAQLHQDPLHLPNGVFATPTIPREISKVIDRSSGQPLLVNIQPSQVAQVVIPHGSSTALIISDEQQHATKGEVIDDPSPHPEPETVGFVGAEPVLKIENSDIPVQPINAIAEMIKADSLLIQHHPRRPQYAVTTETIKIRPSSDYDNIGMQPPAAPVRSQVSLSKKDPNGIYVDISPPGHLPPPHNAAPPTGSILKPTPSPQDNTANHQSGVVHDVPLNVQVQLGSGNAGGIPVKEVVVSINHDAPSSVSQIKDETFNFIRPGSDVPEDMSPPPLPRPTRPPLQNPQAGQNNFRPPKYPPFQTPADFMVPPPRPNYAKPVILPIGAGAIQSSRPGEILMMKPSDYNNDDDDSNEPLQTEDGEEIQESHSRPLFPGQLPNEVQKLLNNKTSRPVPGGIGVTQTLSFGSSSDKTEQNSIPGVREPETIVGSQMPTSGPSQSGFNNNNEAIVSVGSKPNIDSMLIDMEEADKMFGMKLPPSRKPNKGLENITTIADINDILTPPKMEDVMGMSPPPLERPSRPDRRPPLRPSRPVPPFKFEKPATPNIPPAPVNIEVDFPPVRSPDHNKKPFKPEDVFPPRLPDNFVHHEYELGTTPKPHRRPSVTSMPIDSPTSSTTESTTEVNGHSKPTIMTNTSTAPSFNRPKPIVHERPPHIHTQKPTNRPPAQRPVHENKPRPVDHDLNIPAKVEHPSSGQHGDSSKRGEPPFPFDHGPPHSNFGDKMRNPPTPHRQPPRGQPPQGFEKPPNRGSSVYDTPPRGQPLQTFEKPPNRGSTVYEQPSRGQPPQTFEKPPNRGSTSLGQPSVFEQPPPRGEPPKREPSPPRGQSPPFEQPPKRPSTPPRTQHPQHSTSFEHPPSGYDQPPPPPRPVPTGFERPSRPTPGYDHPPHRGQPPSGFEKSPPRRPIPIGFEKPPSRPTFEPPPNRVEPSPHFEGQPAQGQPSQSSPSQQPPRIEVPSDNEGKKAPAQQTPVRKPSVDQSDQQPQPTSVYGERDEQPVASNHIPQRGEPTRSTDRPSTSTKKPPAENKPEGEVVRPQAPSRGRPSYKPSPTSKPSTQKPQSSREEIRPTSVRETPAFTTSYVPNIVTNMITSGSTTIFGDLYTDPLLLQPTRMFSSNQGVQFTVSSQGVGGSPPQKVMVVASSPIMPTHATTLTVTSTLTTVVHAAGQSPSTRTVLLTTTIISTIVDKITETETLVKPTTSTVTQTHTISTTKTALVVPTAIYPPMHKYPLQPKPEIFVDYPHDKGPKPEIFVADPHEKDDKPDILVGDPRDKDTMTISVSSSMNEKDHKEHKDSIDNESILVVVTDKPPKHGGKIDGNIVLGGVLPPPASFPHPRPGSQTECLPECRATRNELCVKQEGLMKCICRPGFARMFPDQPCKPTYTYSVQLMLDRKGNDALHYLPGLQVPGSPKFVKMADSTKEGLNRMIMQSDLRDIYHGVAVTGFLPKEKKTMVDFYVQLSENVDEGKVLGILKKSLRSSNYSLGGTEMFAARDSSNLHIQDFNECLNSKFHDCSEHSRCFNLKGTYTCSCKEGYTDISENPLYPGRLCSDMIGCEFCGYHGACYTRNEQQTCECFQWYTGDRCRINLKVLLIALVTIGAILLALLLVCVVMTCLKRRRSSASRTNGSTGYLRYRGPPQAMDKRAMIVDTSSESSVENLPYVSPPPPPPPPQIMGPPRKPVLRQLKRPAPRPQQMPPPDQRDRSLTVMIPRVKYRSMPSNVTMSTFSPDKHLNRTSTQMDIEQKLISYLDNGSRDAPGPSSQRPSKEEKRIYDPKPTSSTSLKKEPRVFEYEYKSSNMHITDGTSSGERRSKDDRFRRYSDQTPLHHDTSLQHRKYSAGALVSAGYAVSATGGLIHDLEESTIHSNTLKSNRSQFTTLNRSGDHKTMSEARSYDETMIQPQTRPLCTNYSGSNSSRLNHDENHTMVERDLGSTFLLPESHLFKPAGDRGSDISNFDSL